MRTRAVAVMVEDGDLLVIDREKEGRRYCVLPGGGVEAGESPEQACLRELREETGLEGTIVARLPIQSAPGDEGAYFAVSVQSRALRLGGPEAERDSPVNRYKPRWIGMDTLRANGLVPSAALDAAQAASGNRPKSCSLNLAPPAGRPSFTFTCT